MKSLEYFKPTLATTLAYWRGYYPSDGDRKAADVALVDLIANGRDQLAYQIAEVYAVRGEADKAFEWL